MDISILKLSTIFNMDLTDLSINDWEWCLTNSGSGDLLGFWPWWWFSALQLTDSDFVGIYPWESNVAMEWRFSKANIDNCGAVQLCFNGVGRGYNLWYGQARFITIQIDKTLWHNGTTIQNICFEGNKNCVGFVPTKECHLEAWEPWQGMTMHLLSAASNTSNDAMRQLVGGLYPHCSNIWNYEVTVNSHFTNRCIQQIHQCVAGCILWNVLFSQWFWWVVGGSYYVLAGGFNPSEKY